MRPTSVVTRWIRRSRAPLATVLAGFDPAIKPLVKCKSLAFVILGLVPRMTSITG